jgi:hypothetical protein
MGAVEPKERKLLQASNTDVTTVVHYIMLHLCFMLLLVTTHSRIYSLPILFVLFVYCNPIGVLSAPAERVLTRHVKLY